MAPRTWAAIVAGNAVDTATAEPVGLTTIYAPPNLTPKGSEGSVHTKKVSAADSPPTECAKKEGLVATANSRDTTAAPAKAGARKKKKLTPTTKPSEAVAGNAHNPAHPAEPPAATALPTTAAKKKKKNKPKKKPIGDAAKEKAVNVSVDAVIENHVDTMNTSAPVVDGAATTNPKKKKKSIKYPRSHKSKTTDQAAGEKERTTSRPDDVVDVAIQKVTGCLSDDPTNVATQTVQVAVSQEDHDKPQLPSSDDASPCLSEKTLAPTLAPTSAPTLVPDSGNGSLVPPSAPVIDTDYSTVSKTAVPSHNHSTSTVIFTRTVRDPQAPRAHSVAGSRHRRHLQDIQVLVKGLAVPGISYDRHGVCIASDAPEWVRGRVARKVQCIVDDFEAGRKITDVNIGAELELEKNEKAYFGEALWSRIYGIQDCDPFTKAEKAEIVGKLQDFEDDLAAERIQRELATVAEVEVNEPANETTTEEQVSVQLPVQHASAELMRIEPQHIEEKNFEQTFGGNVATQQLPHPQLPFQLNLPQPTLSRQMPARQMPVENTINSYSRVEPFVPRAPMEQQHSYTPYQYRPNKARPCLHFVRGYCPYGDNCKFSHPYPHEFQVSAAAANPRDSAWEMNGLWRPGSRMPTATGATTPNPSRSYGSAKNPRPSSSFSMNTDGSTLIPPGSQGSPGGFQSHTGPKKKSGRGKYKGGKKAKTEDA